MDKRLKKLVDLLLNENATISERDDAAMDLYEFNDNVALNALTKIAKNTDENPIVLNSCGESIASIWIKRNSFDKQCYDSLTKVAKDGIFYVIQHDKPNWLNMLQKKGSSPSADRLFREDEDEYES